MNSLIPLRPADLSETYDDAVEVCRSVVQGIEEQERYIKKAEAALVAVKIELASRHEELALRKYALGASVDRALRLGGSGISLVKLAAAIDRHPDWLQKAHRVFRAFPELSDLEEFIERHQAAGTRVTWKLLHSAATALPAGSALERRAALKQIGARAEQTVEAGDWQQVASLARLKEYEIFLHASECVMCGESATTHLPLDKNWEALPFCGSADCGCLFPQGEELLRHVVNHLVSFILYNP